MFLKVNQDQSDSVQQEADLVRFVVELVPDLVDVLLQAGHLAIHLPDRRVKNLPDVPAATSVKQGHVAPSSR